ncbi:hemolysin III family protein [Tabrizicola sp. WMC-M-20]|nr:hemolysin III family protein [Tabrizicola sp. WMC-M-20]
MMTLPTEHPRLMKRPFTLGELVADGVVHALALLVGVMAFSALLYHVLVRADFGLFAALSVYAAGFFLMFGFSLAYNMAPPSAAKWLLRRFDHSAIYVMIAGTYTAILAQFDPGMTVWLLGAVVWAGAVLGVVVKLALPGRYDGLAVIAYIALGGVGVLAIGPASASLPDASLWLIVLGGVTYVGGVAFYKWHRLRFHNAIWHLCVAIAAGLHFTAIAIAVGHG